MTATSSWRPFHPTAWSVVAAAGHGNTEERRLALNDLCDRYWYPLYSFVRRGGHGPEDAQDLVQGFLLEITGGEAFRDLDPDRGLFRTYLLACLKHYLSRARRHRRALRRGGGAAPISLDATEAERRFRLEPVDDRSADRWYDRVWALTLLDSVLANLGEEWASRGRHAHFEILKGALTDPSGLAPYAELATALNLDEGAVKVAIHRLRKRYRALLREAVGATVDAEGRVEDEFQVLLRALTMEP